MQRLEVSGAVRPIYGSLGVKRLQLLVLINRIYYHPCVSYGKKTYLTIHMNQFQLNNVSEW